LQRRPAEIHELFEKRLSLPRGELARERLEYGLRPTHARGRALADSQDQRPLVELSHKPLGKIPRTDDINVVCAELDKPNTEMPSKRRI
jgi:hypothetical protein